MEQQPSAESPGVHSLPEVIRNLRETLLPSVGDVLELETLNPDFPEDTKAFLMVKLNRTDKDRYTISKLKGFNLDSKISFSDNWSAEFTDEGEVVNFDLVKDPIYGNLFPPEIAKERRRLLTETDSLGNGNELLATLQLLKEVRAL